MEQAQDRVALLLVELNLQDLLPECRLLIGLSSNPFPVHLYWYCLGD